MKLVLIVTGDDSTGQAVRTGMGQNHSFDSVGGREAALKILEKKRYDFIFIDTAQLYENMPKNDYRTALDLFWDLCPTIEIIVISQQEMIRHAVMAVKAGASDYLAYPVNPDEVKYVTDNINESIILKSELDYLRDRFWQPDSLELVRTHSKAMKKVFENARSVAPTRSTVLLIGETGTGKGVLARLLHQHSKRKNGQFISVHCGAIPDTLLESELFGHEKGSFTGAVRRKLGKFEIARGGTIFLDEIGTISSSAQIKLLQIIQDGIFSRVGGEETLHTNVRIISATNSDLKEMCDEDKFRRDLYYRLNVFPIKIPPLRERFEDIPLFFEKFIKRLNKLYGKEIRSVHPVIMEAFKHYDWPGNIRELENLIERAIILETSSMLTMESFPNELFEQNAPAEYLPMNTSRTLAEVRKQAVEDIERRYLKELLSRNGGKINISAADAGITTRQLNKLMKKYGIRKEEFKLSTKKN